MTAVKTEVGAQDKAKNVHLQRVASLTALELQEAIEELSALLGGVTAAPASAEYITGSSNATLTAERVATDTATIDVDLGTAAQAKWNIIADSVDNTFLANMAQSTIKGRAVGAGTGDPTDLSPAQAKAVVGLPTSTTDNMIPRFDGTSGDLQTSTLLLGDAGPLTPTANDGVALGTGTLAFADLFLASGGVVNWNNGNYTITHSAGNLTAVGGPFTAPSFIPSASTVPSNGMYLPAANTLGWAVNTAIEMQLTGTALSPGADGGSSLGTTALGWQNLFGNTGFVLNVENGDWVATHTAGILTVGTGDLRVTTAGTNAASAVTVGGTQTLTNKQLTAATVNTSFTPTANDGSALGSGALSFADLFLATGGVINWANGGITITEASDALAFAGASAGYTFTHAVGPNANDAAALGSATVSWADLFLASGAVVNFNNGNVTITHAAGALTVAGATTVSLGTSAAFTTGTVEVGAASDTTLSRAAAGVLAVEGNQLLMAGKQTVWVPATAMITRTTNGAAAGTAETATNRVMIKTLDFDTTTQEFAQFGIHMPKSWNESTVSFSAVWSHAATTTNFGVAWALEAVAFSDDDAFDAAFGTAQQVTDTGGTTNDCYITSESSAITIAGTPAENDYVVFQVKRVPADAADTMAIDARLHGVKLFLTINAATDA